MATKDDIETLLKIQREAYNDNLNSLISSFNFQFSSLKAELQEARSDINSLKIELHSSKDSVKTLSSRVSELEDTLISFKANLDPVQNRLDSLEDHSEKTGIISDLTAYLKSLARIGNRLVLRSRKL